MNNKEYHLPLTDVDMDKLHFNDKAKEIAKFISDYPSNIPFSLCINGAWGSGKSTMMNFIEHHLDQRKCRIIKFNPWMVSDSELLIKTLFEEIFYAIDDGFTNAKNKFFEYAQKVIPPSAKILSYLGAMQQGVEPRTAQVISQASSETVKELSGALFNTPISKTKEKLAEELNTMFVENNQKIVIFIDELDRLFPDEIITCFQMIKSSLDFPGIFFVVAMDNNVIYDSLDKAGINDPEKYLHKIFQRKYVINSEFQIRTLTTEYLLNQMEDLNQDVRRDFNNILEAIIFLRIDKQYNYTENEIISGHNTDPRQNNINDAYFNVYTSIRNEFDNPRQFLKLAEYLLENFPIIHQRFFEGQNSTQSLHTSFLILIGYFRYPEYITIEDYANFYIDLSNENIPKIIKETNYLISNFYPSITEGKFTSRNNKFVRDLIVFLNGFPDYKLLEN